MGQHPFFGVVRAAAMDQEDGAGEPGKTLSTAGFTKGAQECFGDNHTVAPFAINRVGQKAGLVAFGKLLNGVMLGPIIGHRFGGGACCGHGNDFRPANPKAQAAAQTVAEEAQAVVPFVHHERADSIDVSGKAFRCQRCVVAFAAAAAVKGQNGKACAVECVGERVKAAVGGLVVAETMDQYDAIML